LALSAGGCVRVQCVTSVEIDSSACVADSDAHLQVSKHEEHLAECGRYRAFLDAITPAAHFDAQAAARAARAAAADAAWRDACAAVCAEKAAAVAAKEQAEADYASARTQQARLALQWRACERGCMCRLAVATASLSDRAAPTLKSNFRVYEHAIIFASNYTHQPLARSPSKPSKGKQPRSSRSTARLQEADRATEAFKAAAERLKEVLPKKEPPPPPPEPEPKPGDNGMFFTEPKQLLAILAGLEEQNLFLIQNGQEVEEELEALKATAKCDCCVGACSRILCATC
jgi:hypothetical protein